MNLSSTIKRIQDVMRKDDGVDGDAQRIGQFYRRLKTEMANGWIDEPKRAEMRVVGGREAAS